MGGCEGVVDRRIANSIRCFTAQLQTTHVQLPQHRVPHVCIRHQLSIAACDGKVHLGQNHGLHDLRGDGKKERATAW